MKDSSKSDQQSFASSEAQLQEAEYAWPYHYIPQATDRTFSQTLHYSWGFRYLGGLRVVQNLLSQMQPRSLIDIGCGDGRFLSEVTRVIPEAEMLGIDYSASAIAFAKAFNPELEFRLHNIMKESLDRQFEVATLIEVLEHIEIKQVSRFLSAIRDTLAPGGKLLLTVPHENSPLITKHFQHFDAESITTSLEGLFAVEKIQFFDSRRDFPIRLAKTLLGGGGRQFVITNRHLNRIFMKHYIDKYLYVDRESDCRRMFVIAHKDS